MDEWCDLSVDDLFCEIMNKINYNLCRIFKVHTINSKENLLKNDKRRLKYKKTTRIIYYI